MQNTPQRGSHARPADLVLSVDGAAAPPSRFAPDLADLGRQYCPRGTGDALAEAKLQRLGYPPQTVYEDHTWHPSKCAQPARRGDWETSECILVPSERLVFQLVWKAGTHSLHNFLQCSYGKREAIRCIGSMKEGVQPCLRAPLNFTSVAIVRGGIFSRHYSAYMEVVGRDKAKGEQNDRWRSSEPAGYLDLVERLRCTHTGWHAHTASQSSFVRARPVDALFELREAPTALPAFLASRANASGQSEDAARIRRCEWPHANNADSDQLLRTDWIKKGKGLDKGGFYALLRNNSDLQRTLCDWYAQDLLCLKLHDDESRKFCPHLY